LEIGELQKGSAANNAHASTIAEFDEKIRSLTREDEDEEAKHVAAQEERKKEREELEERKGRVEELERQIEQLRKAFLL
jgi:predicted  nucleic acid-binding Zn-ribbon protein